MNRDVVGYDLSIGPTPCAAPAGMKEAEKERKRKTANMLNSAVKQKAEFVFEPNNGQHNFLTIGT